MMADGFHEFIKIGIGPCPSSYPPLEGTGEGWEGIDISEQY
jgi:hypothetical protein